MREFGDRRTRAVLAVFTSRRSARSEVFFVPPQIAKLYRLSPRDLCWALGVLEGSLLQAVGTTKGKFRKIRLLPEWEGRVNVEKQGDSAIGRKRGKGERAAIHHTTSVTMCPEVEKTLLDLVRQKAG